MSSPSARPGSFLRQVRAVIRKEMAGERRSRQGVIVSALFTLVIAATLGYSAVVEKPSPSVAAGMLASGMIFAAALTVPRTFLVEDEQGTMDLLRLHCDPGAAYLGKLIYAIFVNGIAGMALAGALSAFLGSTITQPFLFVGASLASVLSAAGALAFVSSLVLGASNKWILAAALGVPLLLPQSILSVLALRHSLGSTGARDAWSSLVGLFGFALAMGALGLALAPWLWGLSVTRRDSAAASDQEGVE
jgi:heme exporter protein B